MTIYMTPNITGERIDAMSVFEAFRAGEELLDSRFPRHGTRLDLVDGSPDISRST